MSNVKKTILLIAIVFCAGCSSNYVEDPYRTVPTTNNPNMFKGGVGPKTSPF